MKKTAKASKTIRAIKGEGKTECETPSPARAGRRLSRQKMVLRDYLDCAWALPNQAGRALRWRLLRTR